MIVNIYFYKYDFARTEFLLDVRVCLLEFHGHVCTCISLRSSPVTLCNEKPHLDVNNVYRRTPRYIPYYCSRYTPY
jgi:hypothetical protein